MDKNQNTNEIMQYVDCEFLLSAYGHIRVLMEDAGFGINGGVVLFIPDPNKVEAVIHDLEQCGGIRGQIHGSKIPFAFNYRSVLVCCQANHKPEAVWEFLACTKYMPVYVVSGMLPEWLHDYPNILLLDEYDDDTDYVNTRANCLNRFFDFSHAHATDILDVLASIKGSEQFKNISGDAVFYISLYCVGAIYNYSIHVEGKGMQIPPDYYDDLDETIRDALEFDDIDMETVSEVYNAMSRYLDTETNVLVGPIDRIEGELIDAVAEERAILYDREYYYLPDKLFNEVMEEELHYAISQRLLKSILYQEGVLICNNAKGNYTIKKVLTNVYDEQFRARLLKFSRKNLENGDQLSLVERRRTNVSGQV